MTEPSYPAWIEAALEPKRTLYKIRYDETREAVAKAIQKVDDLAMAYERRIGFKEGFAAGQASALDGLAQEVRASVAGATDRYTGEIAESHVASAIKRRIKAQEASDPDPYDTDTGYEGHEFYEEPWKW